MAAPTFVADEIVTAAKLNSLPKGILGYASTTTAQTGIVNAATALTGLSVSVTVEAGRVIKVTGHITLTQLTSLALSTGRVRESTTTFGYFARGNLAINENSVREGVVIISAPSAGAHTYHLSYETASGSVSTTPIAADPGFILVEDIGGV